MFENENDMPSTNSPVRATAASKQSSDLPSEQHMHHSSIETGICKHQPTSTQMVEHILFC